MIDMSRSNENEIERRIGGRWCKDCERRIGKKWCRDKKKISQFTHFRGKETYDRWLRLDIFGIIQFCSTYRNIN